MDTSSMGKPDSLHSSLEQQLASRRRRSAMRNDPEQRALLDGLLHKLELETVPLALGVGAVAPDLTLTDAVAGTPVRLHNVLEMGPVVLSFYRGEWCPYCNLTARALEAEHAAITSLGASIFLVGPETHDGALKMRKQSGASIPILFDATGQAMDAYGISFELPEGFREQYASRHGFPTRNSRTGWKLPIPATYVIGTDRRVSFRHVDPDYTRRLEPAVLVDVLRSMADARSDAPRS